MLEETGVCFFSCILLQDCELLQGREHLFADCTLVLSTEYCYDFKDVFYIESNHKYCFS